MRQNTPFPRDLKTRYVKPPPKTIDGHVVAHTPHKLVTTASVAFTGFWRPLEIILIDF